ncbi:NAC transcription factor NAM-B2 [Platanthera zijinensis]|uniref:NAC transcription factor NAM-B2 n=1 Tax=Platanthera zijinensis TaxID=2320716 RepID=A0AAP0AT34_9ASPA
MEVKDLLTSSHFPPGFRFHPTDEELISCYLSKKVTSSLPPGWDIVADIDIYKFNPWDLPGKAFFGDGEWFFFSPRERKYPNGFRPNRSAGSGYWKATGTDKPILGAGGTQCIGVKKALVFYEGRPPKGSKTDWVMHEYRILDSSAAAAPAAALPSQKQLDDWVLCRVRKKGNFPAAGDEVTENCSPTKSSPAISRQSEEEKSVMENSCFSTADLFCNDDPLLDYNAFDFYEGRETAAEALDPVFSMRFSDHGGGGDSGGEDGGDYLEMPSEVGSLKRKLSFGMLDELMQLQPGKRLEYSPDGRLFSPYDSPDSVNQDFPDFFI